MSSIIHRGWFQVALGGVALFVITDQVLKYTYNLDYLPTFIMLGAFTVPVSLAAYFYRQDYLLNRKIYRGISLVMASIVFLVGGIIGSIIAGVLEHPIPFFSIPGNFLSIALIEEFATLIFPVVIFIQAKYRSEVDGLVFGVISGIGFAAFETMSYGLNTLMSPGVRIGDLELALVTRGLFAPLGHAAWTGLICGAIWHYQNQGRKLIIMALAYFLLTVVLHTLWDLAANPGVLFPHVRAAFIMYPAFIIIGGVGLFLIFWNLHHVRQKSTAADNRPLDK